MSQNVCLVSKCQKTCQCLKTQHTFSFQCWPSRNHTPYTPPPCRCIILPTISGKKSVFFLATQQTQQVLYTKHRENKPPCQPKNNFYLNNLCIPPVWPVVKNLASSCSPQNSCCHHHWFHPEGNFSSSSRDAAGSWRKRKRKRKRRRRRRKRRSAAAGMWRGGQWLNKAMPVWKSPGDHCWFLWSVGALE